MILRPSQKLNARIKGGPLEVVTAHENPLLDWSAHVFAVGRAEYVLVSNTISLYSAVLDGAAIRDTTRFTERVLGVIRALLDGAGRLPDERLAPVEPVRFAKSLDRSVTGSMNELITHAIAFLADGDLPVADVAVRLNDVLLSALAVGSNKYGRPREAFAALVGTGNDDRPTSESSR
jgi:hypothetical protein